MRTLRGQRLILLDGVPYPHDDGRRIRCGLRQITWPLVMIYKHCLSEVWIFVLAVMSDDVSQFHVTSSTENPEAVATSVSGQDGGVCRDYLRNVCRRGERCRFLHPVDPTSARRDVIAQQSSRRGVVFCHDFQNATGCRRGDTCRYVIT